MATIDKPRTVPDHLQDAQRRVVRRLARLRRRLRLHLLVEGAFWTISAIVVAAAVSFVLDRIWRFNLPTRQVLLVAAVAAIVVVAVRRLVRPLLLPLSDLDLAELLDRRAKGVGQQISNVLQLPELLRDEHFASPAMVEAAVAECAQSLDRVDLLSTLNTSRRHWLLAACAGWLLLAAGVCALWPATANLWARRWLAGSDVRWPQATYLSVVGLGDGDSLLVPRGELSLVQISAQPEFTAAEGGWRLTGRGEPLVVESPAAPASSTPGEVAIAYTLPDGTKKRGHAVQFDDANFRYELPPLSEPVPLHVSGGDDWFGPITIEPIDRPAISSLTIISQPLGSDAPETRQVGEGNSQFLYLAETKLELRLVANQPLESAAVLDKGQPLDGWQRIDERTYVLRWTMQESRALEFQLVGLRGGLSSKPYFMTVGLLKDREPRLTIRSSGVGRRITPVARVPLAVRATDDFGVAALGLEIERTRLVDDKPSVDTQQVALEGDAPPAADAPARIDVQVNHELELRGRELAPGNLVKVCARATDHCTLGTQQGRSRWLTFQVVSADELFYEILTRQREQRAKFSATVESAKEQSTALAGMTRREDAIAAARAQSVINRRVWQVATQLDASLEEMTLNDLGNPQARELMQSGIITPLRTLHGDLLARLSTTVDDLAQQETISDERRDEALSISQQAVDAMQAILAQMAQWESFVDVINQLKHVKQRQDELLKATEELRKKRTDALFDE